MASELTILAQMSDGGRMSKSSNKTNKKGPLAAPLYVYAAVSRTCGG
jgi:hypothetical protein